MDMMQLSLGVHLQDTAHFDNFFIGPNAALVHQLHQLVQGPGFRFIYLYGRADSGKSHLLQACDVSAQQHNQTSGYLDLATQSTPLKQQRALAWLQSRTSELVCLDDIHTVLGQPHWEEALFHLFNRLKDYGGRLVISGKAAPAQLPVQLPDLASRLAWGLTYQLHPLDDTAKLDALILRAQQRGLHMPLEVGRYLLIRSPRRLSGLFALLDTLDQASLKEQRKLTIPFVRSALGWSSP